LDRFVTRSDEAAFTALVRRHGPMVLRLCLRVLQNEPDAEDAFQATFLALGRKAASLRPAESLGGWLYSVAYRIAQKARVAAGRRRKHEGRATDRPVADPLARLTLQEAHDLLDRELARMPEKFRAPLVLCYLEGLARDEAAQQLGWSPSTLKSRLEQARERLRLRLATRGLALSGILVASLFQEGAASAAVPPALLDATVRVTTAAGAISPHVAALSALIDGGIRAMLLTRRTLILAVLLIGCALGAAWGLTASPPAPGEPEGAPAKKPAKVTSYTCQVTRVMETTDGEKTTQTEKVYWAAPGSRRVDTYAGDVLVSVSVTHQDRPGLQIDHLRKTFSRPEPLRVLSPLYYQPARLAALADRADRQLDKRDIKGKSAPGFEVAAQTVDPDAGPGKVRFWIDPDSKLPLRVEVVEEPLLSTLQKASLCVLEDFEWNQPSEKWFALKPPARYKDETPSLPDLARAAEVTKDMTERIVKGLKTFAKHAGGKYPQVEIVYPDVVGKQLLDLYAKAGQERDQEFERAVEGLGAVSRVLLQSTDAKYYGKAVGPDDKDKVLLRWKRDDGRFRVIFGDLRVEDVDEAGLKKLEGK
jgi:RNA polymerase sigma factor (sigma-70 family)